MLGPCRRSFRCQFEMVVFFASLLGPMPAFGEKEGHEEDTGENQASHGFAPLTDPKRCPVIPRELPAPIQERSGDGLVPEGLSQKG